MSGNRVVSPYWRDIVWQASGNSVAQLVGVLGIPILTRLYAPQHFAIQSLFVQVAVFAAGVMTWRYEYFVQLPKSEGDAHALHYLVLALGTLMAAFLTPMAWFYRHELATLLGDAAVAPWLVCAPVTALLISWALSTQHRVQRRRDYKASGLSELAGKSGYIGSGILGAVVGAHPAGLVTATAIAAVAKIAWLWRKSGATATQSTQGVIPAKRINLGDLRRMAREYRRLAGSLVVSHLLTTCTAMIPIVMLAHLYGGVVLGQYALVMATVFLPAGLLGTAIGQVYYQRAASEWSNRSSVASLWSTTAIRLAAIGAPVYALIAVMSPYAYPLVFGSTWAQAGQFAEWMAIAAFFSFVSSPLERTCLIVGAWWYPICWHAFRAVSAGVVAWMAWAWDWPVDVFVPVMASQISLAYAIDFLAERSFSRRRP